MSKVVVIQSKDNEIPNIKNAYEKLIKEFNFLKCIIKAGDKVLIKPNFVAPSDKATTNILLLEYVINTIIQCGGKPIVAESSGFEFSTEETFKILGVDKLCKKFHIPLINLDNEIFVEKPSGNPYVKTYLIPEIVYKVDKIINMPRLKGHSLTKVTFGIKNLFGLLHRNTRRKIHATNLEQGIAVLGKLIKVDFILVDGLWNLENAVFSEAMFKGLMVGGDNLTAVDQICCQLYGVDYHSIPHIQHNVGSQKIDYSELSEIVTEKKNLLLEEKHFLNQNRKYKLLYNIDQIYAGIFKNSIISFCHYYIGICPFINKKNCNKCNKCVQICPVNAIVDYKIISKKCMKIRCFRCYDVCPQKAVIKKGTHG